MMMDQALADVVSALGGGAVAGGGKAKNAAARFACNQVPALRGATPAEQAQVSMWQSWAAKAAPAAAVATLDGALARRSYLVGERLTIADVAAYLACVPAMPSRPGPAARWFDQIQRELRRASPKAVLPGLVDVALPANLSGPVPAPRPVYEEKPKKKKNDDAKQVPAAGGGGAKQKKVPAATTSDSSDPSTVFAALDVRVGKIVEAWKHEEAEKLWCEKIDVGDPEPRSIASGLRLFYKEAGDLKDRMVLVFANLKARTMQGFKSEGMVLCAADAGHTDVKLLEPPPGAKPGDRVVLEGVANLEPPATASQVQKKKMLEKVVPHLHTNADGVACCGDKPFMVPALGPVVAPLTNSPIS